MSKNRIKKLLDYIPLIILFISAIILIYLATSGGYLLIWKHYLGLIFLSICTALFFWNHKVGVLVLGLILLLGLSGILSFSIGIAITTVSIGKTDSFHTLIFYGQPIFLLWLIIHFIVSGRYYVGIVTKKYWDNFFTHINSETDKDIV